MPDLPWKEYMDRQERLYVEQVLRNVNGQVNVACVAMGISRKSLYDKINKHGIALELFRAKGEKEGQR
jgi:two-component system C4-dicarboxylate transport response regulator DctD